MDDYLKLSIMATGLTKAWEICAGTAGDQDTIVRPSQDGLRQTGTTFAGNRIISEGTGLREYSVSTWGTYADWCCYQAILAAQKAAPGSVQFSDEIMPIPVSEVTGQRTAIGVVDTSGDVDKTFFKSFAIIEPTGAQEMPVGYSAEGCRYQIEFVLKEIC